VLDGALVGLARSGTLACLLLVLLLRGLGRAEQLG
jgi:hypothetical protein